MNEKSENYYYEIVGKNVHKYRNFRELTEERLAELIDSSQSYINNIENFSNNKKLSLEMAGRIADSLNIPIKFLFDETNNIEISYSEQKHNNDYFYELFRLNLRRYRKALGVNQEELSKKINMSRSNIGKIESSKIKKHFTIAAAGKFADALNIPLKELFNDENLNIDSDFKRN